MPLQISDMSISFDKKGVPRCEAAVDAAAVRAVEGDDDGDGFGGGGEKGSEEDEGRRSATGRRRVLERREETAGVKGETAAAREWSRGE
ncbi:hypothetical protein Scep_020761 [Stephania cephalantha]|uniref:Uncharacterized protein n=1 Tax=Stephania cephalantha TaxID=152367 RepID=A0AAP0NMS5_9MAGN